MKQENHLPIANSIAVPHKSSFNDRYLPIGPIGGFSKRLYGHFSVIEEICCLLCFGQLLDKHVSSLLLQIWREGQSGIA